MLASGSADRRFPCLDRLNTYRGCVGLEVCGAVRCWSGHVLEMGGGRMLTEVRVDRYTPADCPTCVHAQEVQRPPLRSRADHDPRLLRCAAGLWTGLCSVYNLINHRIPLRQEGWPPCPQYQLTSELRPEIVAKRAADAQREREKRRARREAKLGQSGTA